MLALRNFAQCVRSAEVRLKDEKFGRSSEVSKFAVSPLHNNDASLLYLVKFRQQW